MSKRKHRNKDRQRGRTASTAPTPPSLPLQTDDDLDKTTKPQKGMWDVEPEAPRALRYLKWAWDQKRRTLAIVLVLIFLIAAILFALKPWDYHDKSEKHTELSGQGVECADKDLPQVDQKQFTVLIAQLADDSKSETRTLIQNELRESSAGIRVIAIECGIPLEGSDLEQREKTGHEKAKDILKKTKAHVVIWGRVLTHNNKSLPKLYWTPSPNIQGQKYAITSELSLPEIFWNDLSNILQLLVLQQSQDFDRNAGQYLANKLFPFIEKVEALVSAKQSTLTNSDKAIVEFVLANALSTYGEQKGLNERLYQAVTYYRDALQEYTRERVPLDWVATQNNLGIALRVLGERENGTQRLKEAVAAFRDALKECTRERAPLDWAATQNNLGTALRALGERENSTQRLDEAVTAFRDALKEYTRDRVPLDWAMTQNNLGHVLQILGERENDTLRLEDAVAAYRDALKERTRDRVPLQWAVTQNNLGNALQALGERENNTQRFEDAVAAYRDALKERTRDRVPLQWAMTQNNLGSVLHRLGARENGTQRLEEAVTAYRYALQERTRDRVPFHWAMTQNNLGLTLLRLGERQKSKDQLCQALACCGQALEEFKQSSEYYARGSKQNIGRVEAAFVKLFGEEALAGC